MGRMTNQSRWLTIMITAMVTAAAVTFCCGLGGRAEQENQTGFLCDSCEGAFMEDAENAMQQTLYREGVYRLIPKSQNQVLFENLTDGYQIMLPEEMTADINCCAVSSRFYSSSTTLEIYKETFESRDEVQSYLQYSDQFLENEADHFDQKQEYLEIGDDGVYITRWARKSLSRVKEDKPYYLCADLVREPEQTQKEASEQEGSYTVYTLFFKSVQPVETEEATALLKTLAPCDTEESVAENDDTQKQLSPLTGKDASFGQKDETENAGTESGEAGESKVQLRDYWSMETKQAYTACFGEESSLTWGIFEFGAPEDFTGLKSLEKEVEHTFDILLYYKDFDKNGIQPEFENALGNAAKENRILELTLQTSYQEEGNMIYDILDGELDDYLEQFASVIRDTGQPVLFRLCNEMNGDWCQYSAFHTSRDPELFRQMYRYVFSKFQEQGALPYTIFVWNPNEKSFPDYKWNHQWMYYPGDEYVDVIGLTGYNTGTYYEGEHWRSFDEIYGHMYWQAAANYDKPMMITEFASSSVGGDKAAWIGDMFYQIKKYDRIKAAIWWNGRDLDAQGNVARPYWLNENQLTMEAFRKGLHAKK